MKQRTMVIASYPVTDFKAVLTDASFDEVESSEMASKWRVFSFLKKQWKPRNPSARADDASRGRDARRAQGDIMGDLNRRRADSKYE